MSKRSSAKPAAGVTSLRQLAAQLGVSAPAVQKWPLNPAWDLGQLPSPGNPWPAAKVARLRQWRTEHLSEDPARGGDTRSIEARATSLAKAQKLREEARKAKRENDLAEGLLVKREDVERQGVAKVLAVKTGLMNLVEEMRETLSDEQLDELTEKVHALLTAFAGG